MNHAVFDNIGDSVVIQLHIIFKRGTETSQTADSSSSWSYCLQDRCNSVDRSRVLKVGAASYKDADTGCMWGKAVHPLHPALSKRANLSKNATVET